LAKKLEKYADRSDVVVLALPRGGVPVAYEVARALHAPLDVFVVRKLGVPGHEELAMGAIATGNVRVLNQDLVDDLGIRAEWIDQVATREGRELARRENLYRGTSPPLEVTGRAVILVDDGLATGSTMRAAVTALKRLGPASIIVPVPVAALQTCESFEAEVDATCICVMSPTPFDGVGRWYKDFSQTSDEEVSYWLELARQPSHQRVA
jgi:predicted phosphoribosyltransferase